MRALLALAWNSFSSCSFGNNGDGEEWLDGSGCLTTARLEKIRSTELPRSFNEATDAGGGGGSGGGGALWSGMNKNRDVSTRLLAHPFTRSLAPLTRSLACSLRSLPRSGESQFLMSQNDLVLSHSAVVEWARASRPSSSVSGSPTSFSTAPL